LFLLIDNIRSGYGKKEVLHGVSIHINENEIVVMVGHNGAGKTTLVKSVFGLIRINSGKISYNDKLISEISPNKILLEGIVYVPQERNVFPTLTVLENMQVSDHLSNNSSTFYERLDQITELFPVIKERQLQRAGTLSGGEQKMLALSMALIVHPKLILLDEPSLGLSPFYVKKFMDTLKMLNGEMDLTIFLIEQNIRQSLRIADRVYVMKGGLISNEFLGSELMDKDDLWKLL
jgi:branched-chain amino acid transport system ATP-binding protein